MPRRRRPGGVSLDAAVVVVDPEEHPELPGLCVAGVHAVDQQGLETRVCSLVLPLSEAAFFRGRPLDSLRPKLALLSTLFPAETCVGEWEMY